VRGARAMHVWVRAVRACERACVSTLAGRMRALHGPYAPYGLRMAHALHAPCTHPTPAAFFRNSPDVSLLYAAMSVSAAIAEASPARYSTAASAPAAGTHTSWPLTLGTPCAILMRAMSSSSRPVAWQRTELHRDAAQGACDDVWLVLGPCTSRDARGRSAIHCACA
jgi:hypothetical protein